MILIATMSLLLTWLWLVRSVQKRHAICFCPLISLSSSFEVYVNYHCVRGMSNCFLSSGDLNLKSINVPPSQDKFCRRRHTLPGTAVCDIVLYGSCFVACAGVWYRTHILIEPGSIILVFGRKTDISSFFTTKSLPHTGPTNEMRGIIQYSLQLTYV